MSIRLNPLYSVVHPQYISPSCVPYPPSSLHPLSSQPPFFIFQHPCFTKEPQPLSSHLHSLSFIPQSPFFWIHPASFILHSSCSNLYFLSSILHSISSVLPASFASLYPPSSILHPPLFILQPPFSFLHSPSFILHPSCFIPQPSSSILYFSCSNFYFISTILNPLSSVLYASFASLHALSFIILHPHISVFHLLSFINLPLLSMDTLSSVHPSFSICNNFILYFLYQVSSSLREFSTQGGLPSDSSLLGLEFVR